MKSRKTIHADLENKRSIFLELGIVISLALVVFMMELNFKNKVSIEFNDAVTVDTEQEMIPITRQEQTVPPPPPIPVRSYNVLNIVDDDIELKEELEILDAETNEDESVEVVKMDEIKLEEETSEAPIFIVVEEMPIFRPEICSTPQQGNLELMNYISKSIKFPVIAAENGIEGRVFVTFVVSSKGLVTDVEIARGVHPELDKEALRVVQNLPSFSPGKQRGKPVRVRYSIPINFILQ